MEEVVREAARGAAKAVAARGPEVSAAAVRVEG